jgi:hypothetical protein
VKLLSVAENPHADSIIKVESSAKGFITTSKDNTFKVWKLNESDIFECCLNCNYQNDNIQAVKAIGDSVFSVINNSLVTWSSGNNIPENVYSLSSIYSNIFYPEQGKEIIVYSGKM